MSYAIMRTAKLKSIGSISSCNKHNDRERETLNADKERLNQNRVLIGDRNKSYVQSFQEITKDMKIRKNAVYGIEVFMSASPDSKFFKNEKLTSDWAYDSIKFLNNVFGKENVIKSTLHLDETTPHLHTFVIPVHKGKLNCKHFIGGSKYRLSQLQTDYHNVVKKYGLERGIEGSTAKHQDIKKYYKALNTELERELPRTRVFESKQKYIMKADKEYQKVVLKNLNLNLEIQKLLNQLRSKQVEKEKWEEDKKKTVLERELEKFNKQRDPNRNRTEDNMIKNLDLEMKLVRQELEREKMLKFLDKNPDIKSQIKDLIKSQAKERNKNRDRGRGR